MEKFAIMMFSWSQVCNIMETLMATDALALMQAFVFSTLNWQGIARIHHDRLINHILPSSTPQVSTQLLKYYDHHDIIISNMPGFPIFPTMDQFLGYTLCPPSIKEWTKKLDLGPLIMVSHSSPQLRHFQPIITNPSCDCTSITLTLMGTQPSGTSYTGPTSTQEGALVIPGMQNNSAARLQATLQFYANVSQAGSPSDKVGPPASSLPT